MDVHWKSLSFVGLCLTVLPSIFVFTGDITWGMHSTLMLVGAVLWFITAPLWMEGSRMKRRRMKESRTHVE